jgi:hypothetical protein
VFLQAVRPPGGVLHPRIGEACAGRVESTRAPGAARV